MNVLITGGTGFIGGHVMRGLLKQGHQVVAFDSSPNTELLKDIADQIDVVQADVQDLAAIIDVIKKFEITHIVHMASLLTTTSQRRPFAALNINAVGTVNTLEASRLTGVVRVTFNSSTAVYGYTEEGKPIDEDHPLRPSTIYGATKLLGEYYGLAYNADYGLGFAALRFPSIYGPGQTQRGFSSFKEIVEKPLLGLPAKVPVGGDQKFDIVYVKDVADAIISAILAKETPHKIFNISGDVASFATLRDLANVVRTNIPSAIIEIGPGFEPTEPVRGPLDIRRARNELHYEPKYDLNRGVRDYIDTFNRIRVT